MVEVELQLSRPAGGTGPLRIDVVESLAAGLASDTARDGVLTYAVELEPGALKTLRYRARARFAGDFLWPAPVAVDPWSKPYAMARGAETRLVVQ